MYINNEEYMRAIVGDNDVRQVFNKQYQTSQNAFANTYNSPRALSLAEPNLENINLYPEAFKKINPIVINYCKNFTEKITKNNIEKLVDNIYNTVSNSSKEDKISNDILKDLIQILVLNQIL